MSVLGNIKLKIEEKLEELANDGVIGEVHLTNDIPSVFKRDVGSWPVAIVPTPPTASEEFQNTQNKRTHTFEIWIVQKKENINGKTDMEDLLETLLDKFDNFPSLNGKAEGGVKPGSTPVVSMTADDTTYFTFAVVLPCSVIKDLTFT